MPLRIVSLNLPALLRILRRGRTFNGGDAMNVDICITRAICFTLKEYGIERLARWTLSVARRRMRLARSRRACHV